MPIITQPAADARPYTLTEYDRNWFVVRVLRYASLEALAADARINAWRHADNHRSLAWLSGMPVRQVAVNFRNKTLPVDELVAWAHNSYAARRQNIYAPVVAEWRQGPVPGVSKRRGGSSRRRWRTQQERRDNAFVLLDEGEVAARPCRRGGYLPHSWDWSPYAKGLRGWKGQHKGRKSWDRPVRHGAASK